MRRALAAVAALGLGTACGPAHVEESRCAEVNASLAACLGSNAVRFDCALAPEADIEGVAAVVEGADCQHLAELVPIDGDPAAALCKLAGVGCVAATTPEPVHAPARFPVVLVNGIDTSPLFRYGPRIAETMREAGGHQVFLATLPPFQPPRVRAPLLWQRIAEVRAETGAEKVNLVCHSLGGLDCRYLVSPGGLHWDVGVDHAALAGAVASITTVGTAHHGTRIADVALDGMPDGEDAATIDDLATLFGDWFHEDVLEADAELREALAALSVDQAPAFNAEIVDAEGVYYQSWAGVSRPLGSGDGVHDEHMHAQCAPSEEAPPQPLFAHDWMALPLVPFYDVVGRSPSADGEAEVTEPSDGLTPVASARWGNFRGCLQADHMEQLGQKNLPRANVQSGFEVARFYANVAGDLAARGF
jgi:triacylglycerol lipase